MRLKKELYDTLQEYFLFWKDLTGTLKEWGFDMKPHSDLISNKTYMDNIVLYYRM